FCQINFRKKRICLKIVVYSGEFDFICPIYGLPVYITSSYYKSIFTCRNDIKSLFQTLNNFNAFVVKIRISGNYDMFASWQNSRKTLKSFPTHNDITIKSQTFKAFQIIRQMPNELVVFS